MPRPTHNRDRHGRASVLPTMNSPPDSSLLRPDPSPSPGASSLGDSHHREKRARLSSMTPSSSSKSENVDSSAPRIGPPSPASTGSVIAVGTAQDTALLQSIEQGEYAPDHIDETSSLTDSIRQHIVDGGLRYHAYHAGQYLFPNDETEQYRDDLKHNLTIYLCENNYFYAPVRSLFEQGAEILDLGTLQTLGY